MIAIIDYDAGNLKSVEKALLYLGQDVLVTRDREKILSADKVILPGVGNFGAGGSHPGNGAAGKALPGNLPGASAAL